MTIIQINSMAFVSQADRGITSVSRGSDPLGPGAYEYQPVKGLSKCYAPFWSTAGRERARTEACPGPGAYQSPSAGWPHTITTYSSNNSIIIKLNTLGTPAFTSKIPRFPHQEAEFPGPADYSLPAHIQQRTRTPSHNPRAKSNKLMKAENNAPSISKVNYLSERHAKTEESVPIAKPSKKGVLAGVWGKDKSMRFATKCVTELGPGSYEVEHRKEGGKGSTAFLSSTVRTFDTIVFDTRNADTLALRQVEHYRAEQPAPGTYNIAPQRKTEPPEYRNQTFGSTMDRFSRSKTEEAAPFYEVDQHFNMRSFHKKSVPFNSESKKMPANSSEALPGPGYYSIDNGNRFAARRVIECFGSTAKRSQDEPRNGQALGPGCYEPIFRRAEEVQQSSVFASKQARSFQVSPKPDKKFLAYQLGRGDISQKALEERIHRDNLQKIHCAKPAFDRQTPRFSHYDGLPPQPRKLTGQQLEHLMRQRQEEERQKGIEVAREQIRAPAAAMDRSQRWKHERGGPGVGEYAIRSNWTKKSYNIKYSLAH